MHMLKKYYSALILGILLGILAILNCQISLAETATLTEAAEEAEEAEANKPTNAQIDQLMKYTGGYNLPAKLSANLMEQFKSSVPNVPNSYWQGIAAYIEDNQKALETETYAIYSDLFTADEVTAINQFYGSDAGQKLLASMATISQKVQQINTIWTQAVVSRIEKKLKQDGYLK